MGILKDIGDVIGAFAREVDVIGGRSASTVDHSTSGAAEHSTVSGGSDGTSYSGDGGGTTERRDRAGNIVRHTVRVGDTDYHYDGGYLGWLASLGGGQPVARSPRHGARIDHIASDGSLLGYSAVQPHGDLLHYTPSGEYVGKSTPIETSAAPPEAASSTHGPSAGGHSGVAEGGPWGPDLPAAGTTQPRGSTSDVRGVLQAGRRASATASFRTALAICALATVVGMAIGAAGAWSGHRQSQAGLKVLVAKADLELRAEPPNGPVVGIVRRGQCVSVMEYSDGWCRVCAHDGWGWCKRVLLREG